MEYGLALPIFNPLNATLLGVFNETIQGANSSKRIRSKTHLVKLYVSYSKQFSIISVILKLEVIPYSLPVTASGVPILIILYCIVDAQ